MQSKMLVYDLGCDICCRIGSKAESDPKRNSSLVQIHFTWQEKETRSYQQPHNRNKHTQSERKVLL